MPIYPKKSASHKNPNTLWWTLAIVASLLVALLTIKATTPVEQQKELPVSFYPALLQPWQGFRIAVLSDVHLANAGKDVDRFKMLLAQVVAEQPSLVVLLGDYIDSSADPDTHDGIRDSFTNALALLDALPAALVLGNHDSWTDYDKWVEALSTGQAHLLENKVVTLDTAQGRVCVRGVGDSFSGHNKAIAFPADCDALPKLTLTHDPAGALQPDIEGLVLAGHTHCGQISLPLLGAPWIPSNAPRQASCGFFKNEGRVLFTSGGIGTSILPLRFGAQAGWDLLTIK